MEIILTIAYCYNEILWKSVLLVAEAEMVSRFRMRKQEQV